MQQSLRIALSLLVVSSAGIASADWVIGSGPNAGMGRAGLALPGDTINQGRINPAIYGLAPSGFRFQFPRFSFRLDGIGVGDLNDVIGEANNGGIDASKLSDIAREFGDENIQFGAGAGLGLFFGGLAIDFNGDALVAGLPNATLQNWVNTGAAGNVPIGSRLDAYGLGQYEIGFGYGKRFNTAGSADVSVGVRAKIVRSYYSHRFADANSIQNNLDGTLAPEMGGNDVLDESGFGLDLGFVASSSKTQGLFFGATIENLLEPKTTFQSTLPNGIPGTDTIQPYQRTVNLGVGYLAPKNFHVAADLVDVFNGAGGKEFRAGAQWNVSKGFALRGGYESRAGFTFGVGLGGFNLALGGNSAGQLGYALRF